MPTLERQVSLRGPKFYRDGDERERIMFVNHIDAGTRDGPREATKGDAEQHADAFATFMEGDAAEQAGRAHPEGKPLPEIPMRPLVSFRDPEGGPPPKETGPYARRRAEATS